MVTPHSRAVPPRHLQGVVVPLLAAGADLTRANTMVCPILPMPIGSTPLHLVSAPPVGISSGVVCECAAC
jgi:hypothetical protein